MRETMPEIIERRVASGQMKPDAAQLAIAGQLEALRNWLETNANRRVGLFAGLFARPVDRKSVV